MRSRYWIMLRYCAPVDFNGNCTCDRILLEQLKESWEYDSAEEKKTDAEKLKERGNTFFKVCVRILSMSFY